MHRVPGHGEVRVRGQAGEVPQHVGLRDADQGRVPAAEELHGMLEPKNTRKEAGGMNKLNEKAEKLAAIADAFPNERAAEEAMERTAIFLAGALAAAWATEQRETKKG